jgi:hypothetical protein
MFVASALVVACGGSASDSSSNEGQTLSLDADKAGSECVDEDGDGFGEGCSEGADCDDSDDTMFEQCDVCLDSAEGCACDPGVKPVSCDLEAVDPATKLCKTGLRHCRDGLWTGCEGVAQFN